jgi:aryl-alcohol dehydrogenase-like predicted oxidoreductase
MPRRLALIRLMENRVAKDGIRRSVTCLSVTEQLGDLYRFHASDMHTPVEETLSFLDDAVKAEKIHYIGLSNFTG